MSFKLSQVTNTQLKSTLFLKYIAFNNLNSLHFSDSLYIQLPGKKMNTYISVQNKTKQNKQQS
jgi:hypothetical protein